LARLRVPRRIGSGTPSRGAPTGVGRPHRARAALRADAGAGRDRSRSSSSARGSEPVTDELRIGLNLAFLVPGETGGMETYAREPVAALRNEAPGLRLTAFLSREAAADRSAPWSELDCVTLSVRARSRADRVRGEQLLLPRLARRHRLDLVHS